MCKLSGAIPKSLLNYLERMIRTRKEYPEFSTGTYRVLETTEPTKIFAHSCQDENGNAVIAAHNLTGASVKVVIKLWEKTFDHFIHLVDERPNEKIKKAEISLRITSVWVQLASVATEGRRFRTSVVLIGRQVVI